MNYQDDPKSHYSISLDQYLKDGINWYADCFKHTDHDDMEQFAADCFHAGWIAKTGERLADAAKQPQTLVQELTQVINRRSLENGSNTPDFILADYLSRCLVLFDDATKARATWYGQPMKDLEFNKVIEQGPAPRKFESPFQGVLDAAAHFQKATAQPFGALNEARQAIDDYYKTRSHWEADALIKRQFPIGGVVMPHHFELKRKEAGRQIMEDIEKQTADTLHGFKKTFAYVPADLLEQFNQTNAALAKMWDEGQRTTQEYKDLQKKANELAETMNKVKKEAIEKEAADKMARMVADVMRVADGFVVAAKAIQVFNKEAKEAEATRKKFEHMEPKTGNGGKKPVTDEKGFLFIAGNGEILWALHDGQKYCFSSCESGDWIGWKVEEKDVIEAGHTQLPLFLDHFVRKIMPTE